MIVRFNTWASLLACLTVVLFFTGCASLDKARQLSEAGQKEEALNMAAQFLDDDEPGVRLEALEIIGQIGGDRAGQLSATKLNDPDRAVQLQAIRNVGTTSYAPASGALVALTLSVRGESFEAVAKSVRAIGIDATGILLSSFDSSRGNDRKAYKKMIIAVGPTMTTAVLANLGGRSYFDNRDYFDILVELRSPKVATLLLPSIEDDEVARHVVESLGQLGELALDPTLSYLKQRLGPDNAIVRERLVQVLGNLRDPRAVPTLEGLSTDDDERVRIAVDDALRRIRGF